MDFVEKQVETETVFEGRIVKVRRDVAEMHNGVKALREVVEHPGGVGIVPVMSDNTVLMVRQYRYPMEKVLLEIPAGKLDANEAPLDCAIRELSEETGCTAGRYIDLGATFPSPGYCRETLYLYLALDLVPGEMHLDENEFLSVERIALDDLIDMIMANELNDAKTIIGIMKAKQYLGGTS